MRRAGYNLRKEGSGQVMILQVLLNKMDIIQLDKLRDDETK